MKIVGRYVCVWGGGGVTYSQTLLVSAWVSEYLG